MNLKNIKNKVIDKAASVVANFVPPFKGYQEKRAIQYDKDRDIVQTARPFTQGRAPKFDTEGKPTTWFQASTLVGDVKKKYMMSDTGKIKRK
jgi:hypothetical protein